MLVKGNGGLDLGFGSSSFTRKGTMSEMRIQTFIKIYGFSSLDQQKLYAKNLSKEHTLLHVSLIGLIKLSQNVRQVLNFSKKFQKNFVFYLIYRVKNIQQTRKDIVEFFYRSFLLIMKTQVQIERFNKR